MSLPSESFPESSTKGMISSDGSEVSIWFPRSVTAKHLVQIAQNRGDGQSGQRRHGRHGPDCQQHDERNGAFSCLDFSQPGILVPLSPATVIPNENGPASGRSVVRFLRMSLLHPHATHRHAVGTGIGDVVFEASAGGLLLEPEVESRGFRCPTASLRSNKDLPGLRLLGHAAHGDGVVNVQDRAVVVTAASCADKQRRGSPAPDRSGPQPYLSASAAVGGSHSFKPSNTADGATPPAIGAGDRRRFFEADHKSSECALHSSRSPDRDAHDEESGAARR